MCFFGPATPALTAAAGKVTVQALPLFSGAWFTQQALALTSSVSPFQILSQAFNVVSSLYQAQQQNAYAEYQSGIYRNNAIVAGYQAEDAIRRGEIDEKQHRLRSTQLMGEQRSALAGKGVVVDQDSAGTLLEDTAALAEADAQNIRHNAAMEAWAYRAQASNYRNQSQLALASGRQSATRSLLDGVGTVAKDWYRFKGGLN